MLGNDRSHEKSKMSSLNFTSELKGYPFQTTELKEELVALTRKCDETMEPKEEVNSLSLKIVKLIVKMIIFHSLFFQTSYYSTLLLCTSLKWSLNYSGYPLYIILCSYWVKFAYFIFLHVIVTEYFDTCNVAKCFKLDCLVPWKSSLFKWKLS